MKFAIQACNPKTIKNKNCENSLSGAIENIFPLNTENAFLCWNHIYVPLSYKYDLSYMINDILNMIYKIESNDEGCLLIHWLPDTFRCDWVINWNQVEIKIESKWECTVGRLEKLLNASGDVILPKELFINEWKCVLKKIIDGLATCGYDSAILSGMDYLIEVYNMIENMGILYQM